MSSNAEPELRADAAKSCGGRFAILTGQGRGAIGVFGVAGGQSNSLLGVHFRPAGRPRLAERSAGAVCFGVWLHSAGEEAYTEEVLVLKLGADEFEIHIHGGKQSRESLCQTLRACGFVQQSAVDWLSNSAGSEMSAQIQDLLLRCETEQATRWLLNQQRAWADWRQSAERMLAERDFAGVEARCLEVLNRASLATHLTEPWKIVLAGEPNVGKSSLINALTGFTRAIVHSSPGTTRDVVTQRLVLGGWVVELADTAGQRSAGSAIEAAGIERARETWRAADCRVAVRDASQPERGRRIDWQPNPDLLVANKTDRSDARVEPGQLGVSAATGSGLVELQQAMLRVLVPEPVSLACPLPIGTKLSLLLKSIASAARAESVDSVERGLGQLRDYCGRSDTPRG